ncbi:MAG: flagellar basal body-associated FliL family protein [Oxalobacteraceae bacterium]|jgi:flagellar FliL protein|nr:flagellar basal body-associated FliL family protein [Oxalobacteraceae bacterium]
MADEATAAPEEQAEGEPKKKGPLVKIILIVVGVLLLIGLSVGGTLVATGFFSKKPKEAVDAQLEKLEGQGDGHAPAADGHAPAADGHAAPAADSHGKPAADPGGKELASPEGEAERWKFNYYALEKPLLSNVSGSRKVMQVTLTVMTHYDERVIKNIKTHELALRAGILDVMRQKTEADLLKPDFRKALAEDLRLVINSLLEKYEGFGGIEEVMFTEFVVQ